MQSGEYAAGAVQQKKPKKSKPVDHQQASVVGAIGSYKELRDEGEKKQPKKRSAASKVAKVLGDVIKAACAAGPGPKRISLVWTTKNDGDESEYIAPECRFENVA